MSEKKEWISVSELRVLLEDESDGLFMLRAALGSWPPDAQVKFFIKNGTCGVIDKDGKEFGYLLEPDMSWLDEELAEA